MSRPTAVLGVVKTAAVAEKRQDWAVAAWLPSTVGRGCLRGGEGSGILGFPLSTQLDGEGPFQ